MATRAVETLTAAQARRLAVAAQGLGRQRPTGAVGLRQVRAVCVRLGALQIDSVSVLARAHYLPLWSRLGSYDRELLHRLAYPRRPADRRLFETWAHEASLVPVELEPALRWRRRLAAARRERPPAADEVLARVCAEGPLAASDFERRTAPGTWWSWSVSKRTLEHLFAVGELMVPSRRPSFEREYDVPERVLPPAVLAAPEPAEAEARKSLLVHAAGVLGVATVADLQDWWRLRGAPTQPLVAELVEAGELRQVLVRGWDKPGYVVPGTVLPRRVDGRALLSPFDNLVAFRPRVQRLWGMRIRLEIYTPGPQRTHGYYVLPFLLGDALVARVDLKGDRATGVLRVLAAHLEPGESAAVVAPALAAELVAMATWLGLRQVTTGDRGDLARTLAGELTAAAGSAPDR